MCPAAGADVGADAGARKEPVAQRLRAVTKNLLAPCWRPALLGEKERTARRGVIPLGYKTGQVHVICRSCTLPRASTLYRATIATRPHTHTHTTQTSSLDTVDMCRRYRPPLSGFFLSIRSHTTVRDYGLRCTHARTHAHTQDRDHTCTAYGLDTHACALCCS